MLFEVWAVGFFMKNTVTWSSSPAATSNLYGRNNGKNWRWNAGQQSWVILATFINLNIYFALPDLIWHELHLFSPHLISPHLAKLASSYPYFTSPYLTSPNLSLCYLTPSCLTLLHLTSSYCTFRRLTSFHLTEPKPHPTSTDLVPKTILPHLSIPQIISTQSTFFTLQSNHISAHLISYFTYQLISFLTQFILKSLHLISPEVISPHLFPPKCTSTTPNLSVSSPNCTSPNLTSLYTSLLYFKRHFAL